MQQWAADVSQYCSVGSGVGQPTGIVYRMAGITQNPSHCVVTTAGQLGAVDLRAAWSALPERYHAQCLVVLLAKHGLADQFTGRGHSGLMASVRPSGHSTPAPGHRAYSGAPFSRVRGAIHSQGRQAPSTMRSWRLQSFPYRAQVRSRRRERHWYPELPGIEPADGADRDFRHEPFSGATWSTNRAFVLIASS